MDFNGRYGLHGFKEFLDAHEKEARHDYHEAAHEWVALKLGSKKVSKTLNYQGTSTVTLQGIGSDENYCEVAVAGMLGEAKGLYFEKFGGCDIDTGKRLAQFAQKLHQAIMKWPSDPNSEDGIDPDVPMTCKLPSTEFGGLSVADMAHPIAKKVTEAQLLAALVSVAKRLNEAAGWADFKAYFDQHRKG